VDWRQSHARLRIRHRRCGGIGGSINANSPQGHMLRCEAERCAFPWLLHWSDSPEAAPKPGTDGREEQQACLFCACLNSFVIMADVPTSAARALIDVEQVGMFLFSHLRCCFQVLQLFMGRFLARKDEFATPGAVRSAVTPQRPPLRQTLYVPFSHPGMHFIASRAR
jgi:hypothetical protein